MANITNEQMQVLIKIIAAVETGGQVYGQGRYDDYTPAYTNSNMEISCTIGAFQEYGINAKALLQEILDAYPSTFRKYDNAGIESDLKKSSWDGYSPARNSAKAKAIQAIISSPNGIKIQNKRIERLLKSYIAFAEGRGVSNVDALFMSANFIHQGGNSALTRILKKTPKPYTLDNLYNACKSDTGNQVGAYKSRQNFVYNALKTKLSGGGSVSVTDVINAVIVIAKNEVGYCEKASNAYLDDKTKNAGYNNFCKYWRDIKPEWNGSAWCAVFVTWVFVQAFGLETAKKLLKHYPYVYCPTLGNLFTRHANPQVGDIVIFYRNGEFAHTGIVTYVNGDYFKTIEGNTSSSSGIVANGGAVCEKGYYNSQLPGTKFCRPDYSIVTSVNSTTSPTTVKNTKNWLEYGDTGKSVEYLQKKLNVLGFKDEDGKDLIVDGDFGKSTDFAVRAFQKTYELEVDGQAGKNTVRKLDSLVEKKLSDGYDSWVASCKADNTRVYKEASGSDILTAYPKLNAGNLVDVIGVTVGRYKINIQGNVGYIGKTKIEKVASPKQYPFDGKIKGDLVNLRTNAGVDNESIEKLNTGDSVTVLQKVLGVDGKEWYQVKIEKNGYVRADYVE